MTGSNATYSPGSWVAASSASAWLLVDVALDDPRLGECWTALSGDDAERVLDVLLDGGLAALPGFALVLSDGSRGRAVVRHPATVTCRTGDDEPTVVTGLEGRTWIDVELPAEYDEISISAHGDAATTLRLPLAQGITPAGVLTVTGSARPVRTALEVEREARAETGAREASTDHGQRLPTGAAAVAAFPPAEESAGSPLPDERPEADPQRDSGSSYYGRLLGATVDRDALLAELAEKDEQDEAPGTAVVGPPASGRTAIWQPDGPTITERPGQDALSEAPTAVGPSAAPSAFPLPPRALSAVEPEVPPTLPSAVTPPGGLIDGVPWTTGSAGADRPPTYPTIETGPSAPTPVRSPDQAPLEPSAILPSATPKPPPPPAVAPAPGPDASEGEIRTVNRAELLRSLATPPAAGPTVLALRCPRSHLTPAYSAQCRVCGDTIEDQVPTEEPRPPLGRLVLSTGETVILDRDVILGRAPESAEEDPALRPNLVQLTDSGEVSRMHVRITLDGWQPLLRDLGSANGTTLTLSSSAPQQLRPQEDYVLEPGSDVSLADVVSFRYEVVG